MQVKSLAVFNKCSKQGITRTKNKQHILVSKKKREMCKKE